MRGTGRVAASVGIISLNVVATLLAAPAPGSARSIPTPNGPETLGSGVTLERLSVAGPNQVRVLTIDPKKRATIDIATAGPAIGSYQQTSDIAKAHSALAAINGDFSIDPGRPLHPLAEDGTLRQLGLQNGASFAISQDEQHEYIDTQKVNVNGRNLTKGRNFNVTGWNTGDPMGNQIVAYTPYGGGAEHPHPGTCSVKLRPSAKLHWGKRGVGVYRDYRVAKQGCGAAVSTTRGTVVLSSRTSGTGASQLRRMKKRQLIRLTWSFGWAGVMDSVGGMPMLVKKGKNVAPGSCSSYFCSRNPRTAIGVKKDGTILLVVVDGRSHSSVGMTLNAFGSYMVSLGAEYAVNLDGGGGSTMWTRADGVVNDPSDYSGERRVTNAVLVLPGADTGEPTPLHYGTASTTSASVARRTMDLAVADPGSTGGLMDALVGGDLGSTGPLPASFLQMAQVFRASR